MRRTNEWPAHWGLVAATALLAGCGDGGVALDELATRQTQAFCERTFRCCDLADFADAYELTTIEECELRLRPPELRLKRFRRAIELGRLVYHPERMERCLSLLGQSCETPVGAHGENQGVYSLELVELACDDPFEGLVQSGGTCAIDEECASNLCDGDVLDSNGQGIIEGTCVPMPQLGDPCIEGQCAPGLWCRIDELDHDTRTCAARLPDGAACVDAGQCSSNNCPRNDQPERVCSSGPSCDA
jgi:hypothetical protein